MILALTLICRGSESARQKHGASRTSIFRGRFTIALVGKIEPARF
jgi:hypothetical protein